MKTIIHNILTKLIKPFYGSGIGRIFPFNYIYKIYIYLGDSINFSKNNTNIIKITKYGYKMSLEKGKTIDEGIINLGVWEPHISELIKTHLKAGETFLDLGANIGYMSLLASTIVGENGKVLAFEPSKSNYEKLIHNISLNKIGNIIPYNYGVGDKQSTETLYYNITNPGGSSIVNVGHNHDTFQEEIEIINLDNFLKEEQINFIKMDIEGFEYFAIKGMIKLLKNNKNIKMIFEYSPYYYEKIYGKNYKEESIALLNTLHSIGFNLNEIDYKGNFIPITQFSDFFNKVNNYGARQIDIYCEK